MVKRLEDLVEKSEPIQMEIRSVTYNFSEFDQLTDSDLAQVVDTMRAIGDFSGGRKKQKTAEDGVESLTLLPKIRQALNVMVAEDQREQFSALKFNMNEIMAIFTYVTTGGGDDDDALGEG